MTVERGENLIEQFRQTGHQSQPFAQYPGTGQAIADLAEVARAAAPDRDPAQRPANIGQGLELGPHIIAHRRAVVEPLHQPEPLVDLLFVEQGRRQVPRQQTRASRRDRPVDGVEQAALARSGQGPVNLETGPRRTVDREKFPGLAPARRMEIGHIALRDMFDIGQQATGGRQFRPRKFTHAVERCDTEMIVQTPFRADAVEMLLAPLGCPQQPWHKSRRTDDFRRSQPRQLCVQSIIGYCRQFEAAGRDVRRCQPDLALHLRQRDQYIVAPRVKESVFSERSGGDITDDIPRHQRLVPAARLCLCGSLCLLGNRYLETGADQLCQIIFRRVDRNPAHRDRIPGIFPARCQGDVERRRSELGIIIK